MAGIVNHVALGVFHDAIVGERRDEAALGVLEILLIAKGQFLEYSGVGLLRGLGRGFGLFLGESTRRQQTAEYGKEEKSDFHRERKTVSGGILSLPLLPVKCALRVRYTPNATGYDQESDIESLPSRASAGSLSFLQGPRWCGRREGCGHRHGAH